jgi:deazaflavin-dependent oxidoreductase (nitroreductase family)
MTEAKLAPNLPDWMVEHANRYLSSGGADGHMYKVSQSGRPDLTVPSLLLTTTGRKSGEQFIFPLFYGKTGNSYIVVASKGGAPQHPGWYRNILANPEVEVQVGTAKMKARARTAAADYQKKTEGEIPVVVTSADITLCKEKLPCRSTKKVTFASATRRQAPASHCWSPPGAA